MYLSLTWLEIIAFQWGAPPSRGVRSTWANPNQECYTYTSNARIKNGRGKAREILLVSKIEDESKPPLLGTNLVAGTKNNMDSLHALTSLQALWICVMYCFWIYFIHSFYSRRVRFQTICYLLPILVFTLRPLIILTWYVDIEIYISFRLHTYGTKMILLIWDLTLHVRSV
jgi:hypothetical protein